MAGIRRNTKRLLALAVLPMLGALAAGCGGNESIIGGSPVEQVLAPNGSEEILFWHTYSDMEAWVFEQQMIPAFEKEYPGIRVVSLKKPYETMKGALISESTSGSGPDIVRMDMAWVPEFAKLGLLDAVDRYPDFPDIGAAIHRTALETNKYGGRYYGIPLNMNTKAAIYNRGFLEKAGLDKPPVTMDELIALSERTGWKIGVNGINTWSILPYFSGLGGRLTNEDYTKSVGYLDSPESIAAVKTIKRLIDDGLIDADILSGKVDRWQALQEGKLLMIDEGPWYYTILSHLDNGNDKKLLEDTIAAPFPRNEGQKGAIIGGENLVLMEGSAHKGAAWTFMKWMAGMSAQQMMFKTGLIPTNVEIGEEKDRLGPTVRPYVESLDESFLRPPVSNWAKIDKAFNESFTRMLYGRYPVEEGLKELAAEVEQWLTESGS